MVTQIMFILHIKVVDLLDLESQILQASVDISAVDVSAVGGVTDGTSTAPSAT